MPLFRKETIEIWAQLTNVLQAKNAHNNKSRRLGQFRIRSIESLPIGAVPVVTLKVLQFETYIVYIGLILGDYNFEAAVKSS